MKNGFTRKRQPEGTGQDKNRGRHNTGLFSEAAGRTAAEGGQAGQTDGPAVHPETEARSEGSPAGSGGGKITQESQAFNGNDRGQLADAGSGTGIKRLEQTIQALVKTVAMQGAIILKLQHQVSQLQKDAGRAVQGAVQNTVPQLVPSLEDVQNHCNYLELSTGRKAPEGMAELFHSHYSSTDWLIKEGVWVTNWKSRLHKWVLQGPEAGAIRQLGKAASQDTGLSGRQWA